ncbi:MAG: ABC transporter permease [Candidatus Hinthialibacter antarcticus]|nr:ABC transporter permease [Candidatus Hinthialibacter antarcticus]
MILHLVKKDLIRAWKNPIGLLVMVLIPLLVTFLVSMSFGGQNDDSIDITLHIAVLDHDEEMIGNFIRSLENQRDMDSRLQMHIVETFEDGVRMLEDRKASALLVLPENLSRDLLEGNEAIMEFYPNPAEVMLPRVIEHGTDILAIGVSETLNLIGDELEQFTEMIDQDEFPGSWAAAMLFYQAFQKVEQIRTYVFPPIIQIDQVNASEYIVSASRANAAREASDE